MSEMNTSRRPRRLGTSSYFLLTALEAVATPPKRNVRELHDRSTRHDIDMGCHRQSTGRGSFEIGNTKEKDGGERSVGLTVRSILHVRPLDHLPIWRQKRSADRKLGVRTVAVALGCKVVERPRESVRECV